MDKVSTMKFSNLNTLSSLLIKYHHYTSSIRTLKDTETASAESVSWHLKFQVGFTPPQKWLSCTFPPPCCTPEAVRFSLLLFLSLMINLVVPHLSKSHHIQSPTNFFFQSAYHFHACSSPGAAASFSLKHHYTFSRSLYTYSTVPVSSCQVTVTLIWFYPSLCRY